MARRATVVHLSSKGQLVIPATLRRQLGLKAGQALVVRGGARREIVISPVEADEQGVDAMLRRARSWVPGGRDLVEELHQRRRREREREAGGR